MQNNIYILPAREPKKTPTHHLPTQLTPLIGRQQEVVAACGLLRRSQVRLLTLIGTGGVGKTRLALQVATALGEDFADGVSSVPLAPISDPDLVIPTIAQALGLNDGRQIGVERCHHGCAGLVVRNSREPVEMNQG